MGAPSAEVERSPAVGVPTSRIGAAAPWLFVFLWSSGFVGAKYGTRDTSPLTFLAIRFSIAAVLLLAIALALRAPRPTVSQARWALIAGVLMQAVYLGGVFVGIGLGLPSGVAALITGLHPVVTSIVADRWLGEHLTRRQWAGVALGFAGVVAVVVDRLIAHASGITVGAVVAVLVGMIGISAGTLVQRRHGTSAPLVWSTTLQFAISAAVLVPVAFVVEDFHAEATAATIGALAWAVLALSIGAIMLMLWLLQRHATATVSSLFFLTPALSTIEGAILFGERLGVLAIIGLVVSLVGVRLVTAR